MEKIFYIVAKAYLQEAILSLAEIEAALVDLQVVGPIKGSQDIDIYIKGIITTENQQVNGNA